LLKLESWNQVFILEQWTLFVWQQRANHNLSGSRTLIAAEFGDIIKDIERLDAE